MHCSHGSQRPEMHATSKQVGAPGLGDLTPPQFWYLENLAPSSTGSGASKVWTLRAQNFVVRVALTRQREVLHRQTQLTEYMVVLGTDTSSATFVTNASEQHVTGRAVVIVPPGESSVVVEPGSQIIQLFDQSSGDLKAEATNAFWYTHADPRVATAVNWPSPFNGDALRVYSVDDYAKDPNRLGRIFQSSIGMVNFFHAEDGPRDDSALTPHSHPDFEQCTIHLAGDYVHHVRTSWTPRLADWRPDEHRHLSSPGLVLIPAQSVHTSQAIHHGTHQLIDLFSPPRIDWANRPGWVLNAGDYPPLEAGAIEQVTAL